MNRSILALSLVLPAGPAFAQESPPKAPKTEAQPRLTQAAQALPLTIETADPVVAEEFMALFGGSRPLPALGRGKCHRISLDDERQIAHSFGARAQDWVTIRINPGPLAKLYKAEIDTQWQLVSGASIFAMTTMGMSAKEAAKLIKGARTCPESLESVVLRLSNNPDVKLKGVAMQLSVKPKAGTWLAKITKALRPLPQGAPVLDVADPLVYAVGAMDPEAYRLLFEPASFILSGMGARSKKHRQERKAFMRKLMTCQDGSFAMAGDPFGSGLRTISGVLNPEVLRPLIASDEYCAFTEAFGAMSPSVDAEFEPEDFKHRGVPVSRTTMTIDIDTPLNPAGDQVTFTAVAGPYMVSTTSLTKTDAKRLIDSALDQKVARAPIPDGALALMRFKLVDLMDKIVPFDNPLDGDPNAPKVVQLTFDSRNQALNFAIEFK